MQRHAQVLRHFGQPVEIVSPSAAKRIVKPQHQRTRTETTHQYVLEKFTGRHAGKLRRKSHLDNGIHTASIQKVVTLLVGGNAEVGGNTLRQHLARMAVESHHHG